MIKSVKILAHDKSLSPLLLHLWDSQWSEEEENRGGVENGPVLPGWHNSASC